MTQITKKPFGKVGEIDNFLYTMKNGDTEIDIMNYGATIVALRTPDANGKILDIVCGYETLEEYQNNGGYFGAIIGRNSNRIANATYTLNGKVFEHYKNDGNNNLHGGKEGFDMKMWNIEEDEGTLVCTYHSPDGECGFSGNADVKVTYGLTEDRQISLNYSAVCDEDTVMNLTNHTYFNLNGQDSGSIEGHVLTVFADEYTPVDRNCCPTGEVLSVDDTVFDFRDGRVIGEEIDEVPDFEITAGYDHNFILNGEEGSMNMAATATGELSGISMDVFTTKPAIQFYAGNMMDDVKGKNGAMYSKRHGFCLETQVTPNCHNIPELGNAFLKKGEVYSDFTIFNIITF